MSIVISDPKVIAELEAAIGRVDLTDPTGRLLATATPSVSLLGIQSPFSDGEIERRRMAYTSGKASGEIFKRLRSE